MTEKEVRAYLQTYCGIDLREEDCTLENVLNLIPNVEDAEQSKAFSFGIPLSEHCFDSLVDKDKECLSGHLTIQRKTGVWVLDWDCCLINGLYPQDRDLMKAALYMCEFCAVNGIGLNIKNLKNNI